MAARASRWPGWIFDGPAPNRPSAGFRSAGIPGCSFSGASVTGLVCQPSDPSCRGVQCPSRPDAALSLRIDRVPYGHPDALLLIEEVQAEYVRRYGSRDETPARPGDVRAARRQLLRRLPATRGHDLPVATGAWRMRSDVEALGSHAHRRGQADVRRRLGARRRVTRARCWPTSSGRRPTAGAEVMILETGMPQPEAIAPLRVRRLHRDPGLRPLQGLPRQPLLRAAAHALDFRHGHLRRQRAGPGRTSTASRTG